MTNNDIVKVDLGARSYDVVVGEGLLKDANKYIKDILPIKRVIIITDENVAKVGHLSTLKLSLKQSDIECDELILPAGESTKSFTNLQSLLNDILNFQPERSITILALGGGVIGDIAGFAASILMRGVNFIQIPTTLLAMVDSSVGGKTGINTDYGKNLVGSFYQPKLVLADISTLETLPRREVKAGYAEIIKYGLVDDLEFFEYLESVGEDFDIKRAVITSCKAKARIVAEDEKESGKRALLNLGHTFAHALEAEMGYDGRLLHGEAVAVGMVLALKFSENIGICKKGSADKLILCLKKLALPSEISDISSDFNADKLLDHMFLDKKVENGKLVFILAKDIGKAFIKKDVDKADMLKFLANEC